MMNIESIATPMARLIMRYMYASLKKEHVVNPLPASDLRFYEENAQVHSHQQDTRVGERRHVALVYRSQLDLSFQPWLSPLLIRTIEFLVPR